ncbi:UDP-N-acetylmuramoyl-L-alanyl-D-glutamate--2,6-diaminopimelate ligase [Rhodohalobacter sp. SW132]|uniref:UDP-N-acetylmuramoyl-L-alanyl-D-glutamate--2, 6-diaminopimelate ligase n=1 Tax=Rhodohalobacter sp. SW132 TaxID=2293433 RepID=UPI000E27DF55|nr:UDP-N-acetylmuramoyl-L-alanyl-D-glutamate--2,6-diaminopimelate ligase [Rhodohalobacter sp. SW132]REL24258.1 UDP-N-acetylmuramoyl-L-alanyl-D-glutamate--2,6-diaminopimelate ligase [Rhodohalobacter sp. SW132]
MTFKELIIFCDPSTVLGSAPDEIGMLCQDSRKVSPGDIFIAIKGLTSDGHKFIDAAVENGASVVISEKPLKNIGNTAVIVVDDTRALVSPLAQKLMGNPAEKLTITGVTGTNGKTTVATLIWQALTELGQPASLLGTVEKRFNKRKGESALTTADPIEIARDMKRMVDIGSKFLVMEVSSHALEQQRTSGIPFYVSIFTNLSHDHLDYHGSMEKYAAAKKKLFDQMNPDGWAIANVDDPRGEWITSDTAARVLGISFEKHSTVHANIVRADTKGTQIDIEDLQLRTPLIGIFNAYNAVQALLACTALGFDGNHIADVLSHCPGAAGRMERVNRTKKLEQEPVVIVDYAHTPDALKNVSRTLSELKKTNQNLVIVFGCGGDRDKAKRPEMAKIAETYGDRIVVTSDNPRTEKPEAIIKDILKGFNSDTEVYSNLDRKETIRKVISEASINDIILIAGKGHETYQEINGVRNHFDDREIARKALAERASGPSENTGGN